MLSDKNKRTVYDQFGEEGLKSGGAAPPPSSGGYGFPGGSKSGAQFSFSGFPGASGAGFRPSNADEIFRQFFTSFGAGGASDDEEFGAFGASGFPGASFGFPGSSGVRMGPGFAGRGGKRPQTIQPVQRALRLTLEELYSGITKKLKVTRKLIDGRTTEKILSIQVTPGWKAGTKIKFAGEGDELPGSQAQDIEFIIEEVPHTRFQRSGDNLILPVEISLTESLCGFTRTVQTLDGRNLRVSTGNVTSPDYEMRFNGEGMPNSKTGAKGDLVVQCKVRYPPSSARLTDVQKEQLKSMGLDRLG